MKQNRVDNKKSSTEPLIPVIDLFAGPGGLGEGFSSLETKGGIKPFQIKLSIEKDTFAHRTLELRSFFRKFARGKAPEEYYLYLQGKISREDMFECYPDEAREAMSEAWLAELGATKPSRSEVKDRISKALQNSDRWVLVGGPPCQAYSIVGRSRMNGKNKEQQNFEKDHRHFLYREYLRIIADHHPPFFVMENVKGILSSTVEGKSIFKRILSDLKHPYKAIYKNGRTSPEFSLHYDIYPLIESPGLFDGLDPLPSEYVVKAEDYGIPQARHRVFLLGIRSDLDGDIGYLQRSTATSLWDVIGDLPPLRSQISRGRDSLDSWHHAIRSICDQKWFKDGTVDQRLRDKIQHVTMSLNGHLDVGQEFIVTRVNSEPKYESEWFIDKRIGGVCNHVTRAHREDDLRRYVFASAFAQIYGRSIRLSDFPKELRPQHKNVNEAVKNDNLFSDRFRVQLRNSPATTVMSHIAKDGHYFIHPDPAQCRSLTVREAARLQTFPDNYFFEGPRTEQYKQVGNAVPPLLARQIAQVVYEHFCNSMADG